MMNRAVSRRYAQALLMIAKEKNVLDQYEKELTQFQQVVLENATLKELMDNPKVLTQKKKQVIEEVSKGSFDPVVTNFLNLIVDKRREAYLMDIINEFKVYADTERNIVDAEVKAAVQLSDSDFEDLKNRLSKATGKNVRLVSTVDESLIGGVVVRIGDTVMDGSLTKRLSLMKNSLQQAQFEGIGVIE